MSKQNKTSLRSRQRQVENQRKEQEAKQREEVSNEQKQEEAQESQNTPEQPQEQIEGTQGTSVEEETSEASMNKQARGLTSSVLHIDEPSFTARASEREEQTTGVEKAESSPATEAAKEEQRRGAEPVARPIEKPVNEAEVPKVKTTDVSADDSDEVSTVKERLNDYLVNMKPGKPHPKGEGVQQQLSLYRLYQYILRQRGETFTKCMDVLMDTIANNRKGAFNDAYAFRYIDQLSLGPGHRSNFQSLQSMFVRAADPKTRAMVMKQIDMSKGLKSITDSTAQQLVEEYFNTVKISK